jgi:S1-C subfamily serine protease
MTRVLYRDGTIVAVALLMLAVLVAFILGCSSTPAVHEPVLPPGAAGAAANALLPSVVDVRAWGGGVEGDRVMIGTGVVVEDGGLIVTNDHVVTGDEGPAESIEVVIQGGERLEARLVGRDPSVDLAVLQVQTNGLPVARFISRDGRVGQAVLAIGAPRTLDDGFATGRVTAVREGIQVPGRDGLTGLLETDAALQPGYSGGPIADRQGRVLGISIGTTVGEDTDRAYAIPSSLVLPAVRRMLDAAAVTVMPYYAEG